MESKVSGMIKAGIIGSTGYAGQELARLLLGHGETEIIWYGSKSYVGESFSKVYANMFEIVESECLPDNLSELAKKADVIFTATPQGYLASQITGEMLNNAKIIDLSADFRLKDVGVYEQWYGITHAAPSFIDEAVYGLAEFNRDEIAKARLIANPGCYPTCSVLSIFPLLNEGLIDSSSIIIDAKSGTSGAGRGAKTDNLYCEVNESIKAYGVTTHRHTPEIEEQLSKISGRDIAINFTPHLVPMNRGILITAYANINFENEALKSAKDDAEFVNIYIKSAYHKYYDDEEFIRVVADNACPETRWVRGSNYVDVNCRYDARTGRVIMMGAMDNLIKGAAGQAVQNMNLMFGLPENTGLKAVPMFP
jgi:N-acetyl-gamma-glutamyl-phosphate reductase